jgi:hypothetical protein
MGAVIVRRLTWAGLQGPHSWLYLLALARSSSGVVTTIPSLGAPELLDVLMSAQDGRAESTSLLQGWDPTVKAN